MTAPLANSRNRSDQAKAVLVANYSLTCSLSRRKSACSWFSCAQADPPESRTTITGPQCMRAPYHRFFLDPPPALVFAFAFAFAVGMAFFAGLPSPIAAIVKVAAGRTLPFAF